MHEIKLAFTVPELMAASGVGRTTIYEEVKAGRLVIAKVGAKTIVPVDRAREWLKAREVTGAMPPRNPRGKAGAQAATEAVG